MFKVFDIVIHRFLELPPVAKGLETILDHLGGLYKFHGKWSIFMYYFVQDFVGKSNNCHR